MHSLVYCFRTAHSRMNKRPFGCLLSLLCSAEQAETGIHAPTSPSVHQVSLHHLPRCSISHRPILPFGIMTPRSASHRRRTLSSASLTTNVIAIKEDPSGLPAVRHCNGRRLTGDILPHEQSSADNSVATMSEPSCVAAKLASSPVTPKITRVRGPRSPPTRWQAFKKDFLKAPRTHTAAIFGALVCASVMCCGLFWGLRSLGEWLSLWLGPWLYWDGLTDEEAVQNALEAWESNGRPQRREHYCP